MSKIKFNKEAAVQYRQQGMTHKQISEVMGCSVDWVNKAVVGVVRGDNRVDVDNTKLKAIQMVKELLKQLEEM